MLLAIGEDMSLANWPKTEQPREKLLAAGAERLSDAELLAIFIHTGIRGKSALEIARGLLVKYGDLGEVLKQDRDALCAEPGLGTAKVASLEAAQELAQRQMLGVARKADVLDSSAATRRYLLAKYQHLEHEVFSCVYLNNQHHVVKIEELFRGTIDGAAIYPREVVKRCLYHNAAAVIFAHNHPSGVAEPSQPDLAITSRLKQALATVDIRVLDHLIIGAGTVVSLAERGVM